MSELNRVLDDRLESFRPHEVPPFTSIKGRYARRRRARTAGAVALSTVMLASVAVIGASLVQQDRGPDSLASPDDRGAASVSEVRSVLCPFADRPLDTQAQRLAVVDELSDALSTIGAFTPEAVDVYDPALRMVNVQVEGLGGADANIPLPPGVTPQQPQTPPSSTAEISAEMAEKARQEMLAAQADLKTDCG